MKRLLKTLPLLALATSLPALAHHGKDFLQVETAHLPAPGDVYGTARQDYIADHEDEIEFEPALLAGVTNWMAVELHSHIARPEHESTDYEATAAALQFRFTSRENPLSLGATVEYERARHAHERDMLMLTAIAGYESRDWHTAINITRDNELDTPEAEWRYGAGTRYRLTPNHGIGIELTGSFEGEHESELMAGYYFEGNGRLTVNVGIGTGIHAGPDWTARTALIWHFN